MKKVLSIFAITAIVALSSCGNGANKSTEGISDSTEVSVDSLKVDSVEVFIDSAKTEVPTEVK